MSRTVQIGPVYCIRNLINAYRGSSMSVHSTAFHLGLHCLQSKSTHLGAS